MQIKQVYVNDAVIGEAQTWPDVENLLREKNVQFEGKPSAVEGPAAFFLQGTLAITEQRERNKGYDEELARRLRERQKGIDRARKEAEWAEDFEKEQEQRWDDPDVPRRGK